MTMPRDEFSAFDEAAGIDENQVTPATPPKNDEQTNGGEDRRVTPEHLARVEAQRDQALAHRDQVIMSMLGAAQNNAQAAPQEPQERAIDKLDDETRAYLKPVFDEERALMRQEIMAEFGPILRTVEHQRDLAEIEEVVPGFRGELAPDVDRLIASLSPEKRDEYDNKLGLENLGLRALVNRLMAGREVAQDAADMAHSESFASQPPRGAPTGREQAEAIWNMSDDEFDAATERARLARRR